MDTFLAIPGQVIDAWSSTVDAESQAIVFRTLHMEVMRLHLNPGTHNPTHEAQGEIVIQCVAGRVAVVALNTRHELTSGQLLYLLIREPFDLFGIEESSLLITILRPDETVDLRGEDTDYG